MTDPVPSHDSCICTFADCPERKEHMKGDRNGFGRYDDPQLICPDGGHLSARIMDYSKCIHPNRVYYATHACGVGRGSNVYVDSEWCEAALCAGVCPRGFRR
jgi:hypothetical protein